MREREREREREGERERERERSNSKILFYKWIKYDNYRLISHIH